MKNLKNMYKKTFNTVSKGYDHQALRFFSKTAEEIPSFLDIKGDEHILDVATGTGVVALNLASLLPHGEVTGIDLSIGMLEQAREKCTSNNVTFVEMDMQNLAFDDGFFDKAVASFSIFFVEDMSAQLRLIATKVKPSGEVLITSFYKDSFQPLAKVLFDRLKLYGVEIPDLAVENIDTTDKCIALFEDSDLSDIRCEMVDFSYHLKDFDMWWHLVWNAGFRGFVSQLSEEDLPRFRAEHEAELEALMQDEGLWLEMHVIFCVGKS